MATKNAIGSNKPIEVAFGGTGQTSLTAHSVLVGNATGSVTPITAGTTGQVLVGNTGADPSFAAPPGATSVIVTTYNVADSPAMWTMNASTKYVKVFGFAGGGGGGSGRKGTTAASGGGGAGAAGGMFVYEGPAAFFASGTTVTIGAGGAGGLAQSGDGVGGNVGGAGNPTSFGNIVCLGGGLGQAGSTGSVGGSTAGVLVTMYTFPTTALTLSGGGSSATIGSAGRTMGGSSATQGLTFCPSGGGGGSGADTVTPRAPGAGGSIQNLSGTPILAGGLAAVVGSTINGGDGNPASAINFYTGGTGGGGGVGYNLTSLASGNGGHGGLPGGGGGGGGGGISTVADSGAGGNGGDGQVIVVEFT